MLGDESLQQVLHPVCHNPAPCFTLLGGEVTSLDLGCKHFLGRHPRLMKRYAPVWSDGIFAQFRPGTAEAVEDNKHLATVRRYLHAEAGTNSVPVDQVGRGSRERVDGAFGQFDSRHAMHLSGSATFMSHR